MVTTEITDGKIKVSSPYHPEFPKAARRLGGKWDGASKTWRFDARDEERVRELCREVYGEDGRADAPTVTIRATCVDHINTYDLSAYVAGRQVARAFDRDGGARLGDGMILISGGFGSSGSRKNPTLTIDKGTIIEIRDVPVTVAEAARQDTDEWDVQIITPADVDRDALRAEAKTLRARLQEIQAMLGEDIEVAS